MKKWQRVEPTNVVKVGWRKITAKTFRMPSGETEEFSLVHPDGQQFVNIIALNENNEVIVARQFRPGPEKVMDELPGGFVDGDETPEQSARRELLEETGYEVGSIDYLGSWHKDTYMNAVWHSYIARDCRQVGKQKLDEAEYIEVDTITIDKLIYNAKNDKMTDHAAILLAIHKLEEINETTN